jgi:hypothetical protein
VARDRLYVDELITSAQLWLLTVRRMRPQHSWDDVVRVLNSKGHSWTIERLRRAVHRLVQQRIAEPELIKRSPRRPPEVRRCRPSDLIRPQARTSTASTYSDGSIANT